MQQSYFSDIGLDTEPPVASGLYGVNVAQGVKNAKFENWSILNLRNWKISTPNLDSAPKKFPKKKQNKTTYARNNICLKEVNSPKSK